MQTFRLEGLPSLWVTDETRQTLEQQDNKSEFVRRGIVAYATALGFQNNKNWNRKPAFMLLDEWQQYVEFSKNSRSVDYAYLVAFAWLKSKPRFSRISSGKLLRKIIAESNGK